MEWSWCVNPSVHLWKALCSCSLVIYSSLTFPLLGSVWLEEWKSGRMEKWKDKKDLVFPHMYLVGGVEKWEGGKLFCLVREKNGRIENVVYINWLLYPCYIIGKK